MQPSSLVHVIDDDEAVAQSLAFLLRSAQHRGRTYEFGGGFSGRAAERHTPAASSPTCGCRR